MNRRKKKVNETHSAAEYNVKNKLITLYTFYFLCNKNL